MATMYVSTLGDDGAGVRDDPLWPYLTIQAAETACAHGDDFSIADGTYKENDIAFSGYLNFAGRNNLTINSENDYGAIIQASDDVTPEGRIIHIDPSATGITIGKVILDAENFNSGCITSSSTTTPDITLDGTRMINSNDYNMSFPNVENLTLTGGCHCELTSSSNRVAAIGSGTTAGVITIEDLTINGTSFASNGRFIDIAATVDGVTLLFSNVSSTVDYVSSTASDTLLRVSGVETVDILSPSFTLTGTFVDDRVQGIMVLNHATIQCDHCLIDSPYIDSSAAGRLEYGVLVGDEGIATRDQITTPVITGATVKNANHALMLAHVTNGKIQSSMTDGAVIGVLGKGTITCRFEGLITMDCTNYNAYMKGDTNSDVGNNTFLAKTVMPSAAMMFAGVNDAEVPDVESTGTSWTNNICYAALTVTKYFNTGNTSQTSNLENNCFFSSVAHPTNPWAYQAVNKTTISALETAINIANTAADNINVDPLFTDYANADYTLTASSPCVGTGKRWWTNANPVSYGGEPVADTGTDIGGIMSTHGPFHPTNL